MQTGIKILVTDDEDSIRSMLCQVLSDEGHEVEVAESGEAALDLFRKHPFSIVITDIRMAGMSGLELLQEIKGLSPDVAVIIMTSYASMETAIEALRNGAYDYLIKPFEDLSLVVAAVDRAVEKIGLIRENQRLVESLKRNKEELENLNSILMNLAIRDGLTDLYNHRHFFEILNKEIDRSQRHGKVFSLIFMDVDFFKHYNDTHGHIEGDNALRSLADILRDRLRKTDIVARYGGEEFIVLLPETHKEFARNVAEEIRKSIEEHPFPGRETQPSGRLTMSMGLATYPGDGKNSNDLIKRVDEALYRAKQSGRNVIM